VSNTVVDLSPNGLRRRQDGGAVEVSAGATRNRRVTLWATGDGLTASCAYYRPWVTDGIVAPTLIGTLTIGVPVTISSTAYFVGWGRLFVEDL
jgi:hypothetical protein